MDYLEIGPTPAAEDCIQAGTDPAAEKAECRRFIDWIREVLGPEPQGCALRVKGSPHDFGTYYEVFCYFDENTPEAIAYAFACEGSLPERWTYTPEEREKALQALTPEPEFVDAEY